MYTSAEASMASGHVDAQLPNLATLPSPRSGEVSLPFPLPLPQLSPSFVSGKGLPPRGNVYKTLANDGSLEVNTSQTCWILHFLPKDWRVLRVVSLLFARQVNYKSNNFVKFVCI